MPDLGRSDDQRELDEFIALRANVTALAAGRATLSTMLLTSVPPSLPRARVDADRECEVR
jgi:hypothetical protein